MKIRNYIGHYQNIHPKVLYFENGLFGYKYWMGYTPFPYATEFYENPCIAVSHNGIDWTVPDGLQNPLAYAPTDGYNSDTHLVYREDTNILELWYRPYDKITSTGRLVRRTTTDGVNWTPEEVIPNIEGVLSPSILFEDGKYKLWYPTNRKAIAYTESIDDTASNWTTPIETILPNITAWHMDVIKTNNGLEFLIQGWEDGGGDNNHSQLYYAIEKNGVMSKPVRIADKTLLPEPLENYRGLYRSSFILINGVYSLYYSFIKKDWEQGMFLAQGTDILHLNPYNREINRRNDILVIDQDTVMSDYYIHSANTIHIKDCIVTLESFTNAIPNSVITIVVSRDDGICTIKSSDRIIGQNKTITTNESCRILAISSNSGVLINQS